MAELCDVAISRGLLTGRFGDGTDVAVPVQPAVVAAANLTTATGREAFRFEIDGGSVAGVRRDQNANDVMHRFFKNQPARVCLGGQVYTASTRGRHKLQITLPGRGADLFQASALLQRSHPRGAPRSGIVITARFVNEAAQERVRQSNNPSQREDPWSPAWTEGTGLVVGALTISRLFHGNPRGRAAVAAQLGIPLPATRSDAVTDLGLVWVSRIAVDAPYRGQEIGTELLRVLRTSIGATLPWEARKIEVLQSVPRAEATAGSRFFTAAGYRWHESTTYTAPARMINQLGVPEVDLTPLRTLYYWADIDPQP